VFDLTVIEWNYICFISISAVPIFELNCLTLIYLLILPNENTVLLSAARSWAIICYGFKYCRPIDISSKEKKERLYPNHYFLYRNYTRIKCSNIMIF
jgi:hypothetical protein